MGFIYCFSNPSMVGILKVGMTERTPDIRLYEANSSDTWRPPTPYVMEFAKQVSNPKQKEQTLHGLLARYSERIHPRREFFRVSVQEVQAFFDLMDGDMWIGNGNKRVKRKQRDVTPVYEDGDYWRETTNTNSSTSKFTSTSANDSDGEVEMEFDF